MGTTVVSNIGGLEAPLHSQAVKTLADVRDRLSEVADHASQQVRLQISAINTVARASGCAPDDLPADPARLRKHLAAISPAMAGLTRGSWCSVRSRILKALQRADVQVMPGRRTKPLTDSWATLYRALIATGPQAALGKLISYFSEHGISPDDVSDSYTERFAWAMNTSSLGRQPNAIVRNAIRSWNAAVEKVPGWPQHRLTLAERRREGYVLPPESFPESFQKSLSDYLSFLADPPDDDDAPLRGLRPTTLKTREFLFRQMASALVHRGVPVEEISLQPR
jgi:hypothetical protein